MVWSSVYDWVLPNRHQEGEVHQTKTNLSLPQDVQGEEVPRKVGREGGREELRKLGLTG